MDNGWIKQYRKIREKGWYKKSQYVHLWDHLCLSVNHKAAEFLMNGKIVHVEAGQFVTGRKRISEETGIPESTVEDILKVFENEHQIQQQKTRKFRFITVVNWKKYQCSDSTSDDKATTEQQLADTNKNDKKDKNEKKKRKDTSSEAIASDSKSATRLLAGESLSEPKEETSTPAPKVVAGESVAEEYRRRWNKFVDYANSERGSKLPKVMVLSEKSVAGVGLRIKRTGFDFRAICNKVIRSDFLLGLTPTPEEGRGKNWQGVTFDWIFMSPHNWAAILNGKYDGKNVQQFAPAEPTKDMFEQSAKVL